MQPSGKTNPTRRAVLAAGVGIGAGGCAGPKPVTHKDGSTSLPVFANAEATARYEAAYDAALAEWPVAHTTAFVPTRYGQTHVIASGPPEAPPLFLLPAMMASAPVWRPNVAPLSEGFRVYCVDALGEPTRSGPTRAISTPEENALWLLDLFDGLRVRRASIAGNSIGGFRALNQAIRYPERVDKVVLISPAATFLPMRTMKMLWVVALQAGLGIEGPINAFFGGGLPWDPANDRFGALNAVAMSKGRPVGFPSPVVFKDSELATVKAKALLLIGDHEAIYRHPPPEALRRSLARLPGMEGHIVPNAPHLAALFNPAFVNARMLEFLTRA